MAGFLVIALGALTISLLAFSSYAVNKLRRYKRKINMYRSHETFQPGPVKAVEVEEFDPRFKTGKTGPSPDTAVKCVVSYKVTGGIDDLESWIICNLAKTANRIFEFGTCTGKTTYLMAANSPPETKIATLTLGPEQLVQYRTDTKDTQTDEKAALEESAFTEFFYTGTPEQSKIEQIFADSKNFDEASHTGQYDLIFIDGSHAQSYVESDSKKALRMVKPGGIVLWHDYRGPMRTQGVFHVLNDLCKKLPLVHLKGTCLVAYRHPVR
jgi:hypothetical protein